MGGREAGHVGHGGQLINNIERPKDVGAAMYSAQAPRPVPPMFHSRGQVSWKGRKVRQEVQETSCPTAATCLLLKRLLKNFEGKLLSARAGVCLLANGAIILLSHCLLAS